MQFFVCIIYFTRSYFAYVKIFSSFNKQFDFRAVSFVYCYRFAFIFIVLIVVVVSLVVLWVSVCISVRFFVIGLIALHFFGKLRNPLHFFLFSCCYFFSGKQYTKKYSQNVPLHRHVYLFIFYGTFEISRYLLPMPWTIESENKQQLYNDHVSDSRAQSDFNRIARIFRWKASNCTILHRDWINQFEINRSRFVVGPFSSLALMMMMKLPILIFVREIHFEIKLFITVINF